MNTPWLHSEIDARRVITVRFDAPGRSTNTITRTALDELDAWLREVEAAPAESRPAAIVFTSSKQDVFIAGADLYEIAAMENGQVDRFIERGQELFERIHRLQVPTVAAINGHCLGGGLELALACDRRVAADVGAINIGLPEIKLGIIPAWGGTTRLTRRLGPRRALPLLLTGKTMSPRRALRARIIDEVVSPQRLLDAARRLGLAAASADRAAPMGQLERFAMRLPPLRAAFFAAARRRTRAKTFDHYPAAPGLIDVVETACRGGHRPGLAAEREAIVELARTETAANLMRLFFLRQDAKKTLLQQLGSDETDGARPLGRAAVIGGGTMGAGIVHALVRGGLTVQLHDVNAGALTAALRRVRRHLDEDRRSKRLSPLQVRQCMDRICPATDLHGLRQMDIVVEAVAEDLKIKCDLFRQLDELARPDAVLASNTSSLSVARIAETTASPGRVIGLHFFNPVPRMPLVEVVRGPASDRWALALGARLAMRLGKTPILVGDGPGFLVNRVLIAYLAEALLLAGEGGCVNQIDATIRRWGMPMGPFELLDQIGLDVVSHIFKSLDGRLGPHLQAPQGLEEIVAAGWHGRKSGLGFYDYRRRRPRINRRLLELLGFSGREPAAVDPTSIEQRLILPMVNEAARLLDEGVADSADTIDLATVLGLGLAPFRGGLVHHAERSGLGNVVDDMDKLASRYGERFRPCDSLRRVAASDHSLKSLAHNESATPAGDRYPAPTSVRDSSPARTP